LLFVFYSIRMSVALLHFMTKNKRILLKITGDALGGKERSPDGNTFCRKCTEYLGTEIAGVATQVQLAIVVGGGNILRGSALKRNFPDIDPAIADHMGMMATNMNGIMLGECLRAKGVQAVVMSAHQTYLAEHFQFDRAKEHLEAGKVVILTMGTGCCGFTTDTGAIVRAHEIGAHFVAKGTKVQGVFTEDPARNPDAEFLPRLTTSEFVARGLNGILDLSAVTQAKSCNKIIRVFDLFNAGNLARVIAGEDIGTTIVPSN
jgi:uridylate kinase